MAFFNCQHYKAKALPRQAPDILFKHLSCHPRSPQALSPAGNNGNRRRSNLQLLSLHRARIKCLSSEPDSKKEKKQCRS
jgi:hypothetical protein